MNADRIRALNDLFRTTFLGGQVLLAPGVGALPSSEQAILLGLVRAFTAFTAGNDPHDEHDFGAVDYRGIRYFWKIDYYDSSMTSGSDNPADPTVTRRVMTIMCADEY